MRKTFLPLFVFFLLAFGSFAQVQHDRIDLNQNAAIEQNYAAGAAISVGQLLKLNGSTTVINGQTYAQVVPILTSDAGNFLGVADGSVASGSLIAVRINGQGQVLVDGACSIGNFLVNSPTIAGSLHCNTTSGGQIGQALASIGGVGLIQAAITMGGEGNSGGGGGGGPPLGNNGDLQSKNGSNLAASHINDNGSTLALNETASFKGPAPWYDVTGIDPTSGSQQSTTASCNSTTSVSLTAAKDFINGSGILLDQCGPATPAVAASAFAAAPQGTAGSTTYAYQVRTCDGLAGCTASGASFQTTTGNATLSKANYNLLTWTAGSWNGIAAGTPSNELFYIVYRGAVPIGMTDHNYYEDHGQTGWAPPFWIPSTPSAGARNQYLDTTVASGGGTTSIVVTNSASSSVSGVSALHSADAAINSAQTAVLNNLSGGKVLFPAGGTYNIFTVNWGNLTSIGNCSVFKFTRTYLIFDFRGTASTYMPIQDGCTDIDFRFDQNTRSPTLNFQHTSAGLILDNGIAPVISIQGFAAGGGVYGLGVNRQTGDTVIELVNGPSDIHLVHNQISTGGLPLEVGEATGTGAGNAGKYGGFGLWLDGGTYQSFADGNGEWAIELSFGLVQAVGVDFGATTIHSWCGFGTTHWENILEEGATATEPGLFNVDTSGNATYCGPSPVPNTIFNTFQHIEIADNLGGGIHLLNLTGNNTIPFLDIEVIDSRGWTGSLVGGTQTVGGCGSLSGNTSSDYFGGCSSATSVLNGNLIATGTTFKAELNGVTNSAALTLDVGPPTLGGADALFEGKSGTPTGTNALVTFTGWPNGGAGNALTSFQNGGGGGNLIDIGGTGSKPPSFIDAQNNFHIRFDAGPNTYNTTGIPLSVGTSSTNDAIQVLSGSGSTGNAITVFAPNSTSTQNFSASLAGNVSAVGSYTSTISTGTQPLFITSTTPVPNLTVQNGDHFVTNGLACSASTKTANYVVTNTDCSILMNSASATTVTLPVVGIPTGQRITIHNENAGVVTVSGPPAALFRQGKTAGYTVNTTHSAAFTSNTLAGSLLIFVCQAASASPTFGTPTDTQANAFTNLYNQLFNGSGQTLSAWYAFNTVGGADTITVTSANVNIGCLSGEYTGVLTTSPLDKNSSSNASSVSSVSSPSVTTTAVNELLLGVFSDNGGNIAITSPATLRETISFTAFGDNAVTPIGSYSVSATGSTGDWATAISTFFSTAQSVVDGGANEILASGQGGTFVFDGTAWWSVPGTAINTLTVDSALIFSRGGFTDTATVPSFTANRTITIPDANTVLVQPCNTNARFLVTGISSTTGFCSQSIQAQQFNIQTGTSYTFASSDFANIVKQSNAAAITDTVPDAGSAGFGSNFDMTTFNANAAGGTAITLNRTTSSQFFLSTAPTTGVNTYYLNPGQAGYMASPDNVNWSVFISGSPAPFSVASRLTSLASTTLVPASNGGIVGLNLYAYDSAAGTSCTGNTTVLWTISYTDPTNTAQTQTATETITTNGGATGGDKLATQFSLDTKTGTSVTFTTTYTIGTGCSTGPSYAADLRPF